MAGVADTTTEYRLKRSIDAFPASDGSLYLLRTGAGEDYVVAGRGADVRPAHSGRHARGVHT